MLPLNKKQKSSSNIKQVKEVKIAWIMLVLVLFSLLKSEFEIYIRGIGQIIISFEENKRIQNFIIKEK